jgi:hypothetical protein
MDNVIRYATNIQDLTGEGEEYLAREDGTIAAKFYNGNIVPPPPQGNVEEPTLPTAV